MLAVGAANWSTPTVIETFSSQGPTPDGRFKPDITAGDAGYSTPRAGAFRGTSQASPHVAGMAALVLNRFPDYAPTQVADYLKRHAQERGNTIPNNTWGYGFAVMPSLAPDKPMNFQVRSGDGQATMSWDDPDDTTITLYQYQQNDGAWTDIEGSGATSTSHVVSSIANGTSYSLAVRGVNTKGDGISSVTQNVTPQATPPAIPALKIIPGNTELMLTWADPFYTTITGYQYQQNSGGWNDITGSGAATMSHMVTGLINTTSYAFAVRAKNDNGDGDASSRVSATPTALPPQPVGLTATAGKNEITLEWEAPTYVSITGYQFQQQVGAAAFGDWENLTGSGASTTSHTATSLTNNTAHTFRIRATSSAGSGHESAPASATPSRCANGVALPDPVSNPGLLADCNALLSMESALAGAASINWSEDIRIDDWNGLTLGGRVTRVQGLTLQGLALDGTIPAALGNLSQLTSTTTTSWGAFPPSWATCRTWSICTSTITNSRAPFPVSWATSPTSPT